MVHSFRATVAEARRHGDLYFAALLPQDRILKAFGTARAAWQGWVYTPAITVSAIPALMRFLGMLAREKDYNKARTFVARQRGRGSAVWVKRLVRWNA